MDQSSVDHAGPVALLRTSFAEFHRAKFSRVAVSEVLDLFPTVNVQVCNVGPVACAEGSSERLEDGFDALLGFSSSSCEPSTSFFCTAGVPQSNKLRHVCVNKLERDADLAVGHG